MHCRYCLKLNKQSICQYIVKLQWPVTSKWQCKQKQDIDISWLPFYLRNSYWKADSLNLWVKPPLFSQSWTKFHRFWKKWWQHISNQSRNVKRNETYTSRIFADTGTLHNKFLVAKLHTMQSSACLNLHIKTAEWVYSQKPTIIKINFL